MRYTVVYIPDGDVRIEVDASSKEEAKAKACAYLNIEEGWIETFDRMSFFDVELDDVEEGHELCSDDRGGRLIQVKWNEARFCFECEEAEIVEGDHKAWEALRCRQDRHPIQGDARACPLFVEKLLADPVVRKPA